MSLKRDTDVAMFDRSFAVTHIAAAIALGGRRCEQHLLIADAAHEQLMPRAAAAVPDNAGDLGLMHGENHRRGGAGAAERVANIGHVRDAGALAAELVRNGGSEQAFGARRRNRLRGKTRVAIDSRCVFRRDRGDPFGASGETCHTCRVWTAAGSDETPKRAARRSCLYRHRPDGHGCAHGYLSRSHFDRIAI